MAGVELPTTQIQDFLELFRRNLWPILLAGGAGLAIALVVLCFVPPKYSAMTRVEVRELSLDEDPAARSQQRVTFKDLQFVNFQILSTPRIIRVIKDELQWKDYLSIEASVSDRQEYLDKVRERTKVERAKKEKDVGNDYITITYLDEDPRRAAAFANKIRDVWIQETIGAIRDDVQRQLDEAKRQLDKSYKDYTIATQNVQRWQEQYGLSPVNPTNRKVTAEEDPVVRQAEKAKEELVKAESEMKRASDALAAARDRYASEPAMISVLVDDRTAQAASHADGTKPLLDQAKQLKEEIAKLRSEQKGLKPSNKQFGIKQKAIDDKSKELREVEQHLAKSGLTIDGDKPAERKVLNQAKLAAKEEVARAEADYLTRKNEYERVKDRVADLEIQAGRRAFIYTRYNQYQNDEEYFKNQYLEAKKLHERRSNLLEQLKTASMNPYRIIDDGVPSDKPVEPNVPLFLLTGLAGGAAVVAGLIFVREFLRSSYRGVQDAAASLSLPVLGFVNRMETSFELKRARRRQVIGFSASLSAIVLVGLTASLYLLQPKLLPSPMKQAFDTVKLKLK